MNTSPTASDTPQIAVWYFVAATFIFAAPAVFFPEADLWVRIVLLAAGLVTVVGGGIQLGREITQKRPKRPETPGPNPAAADDKHLH